MDTTEILLYLARFFIGSTLLLGTVWLLEKTHIIKNRDLADVSWKSAVVASFLLLLPATADFAPQITLTQQTGSYIDELITPQPVDSTRQKEVTQPVSVDTGPVDTDKPLVLTKPPSEDSSFNWHIPSFLVIPGILAILALLSLLLTYKSAIRSLGPRQRVNPDHQAFLLLFDVCQSADIKATPYLTWTKRIQSPLCLPTGEICLPEWTLQGIPDKELKSLIAHEVAHLRHRDPIKLLILHALTRLFFLQPLFVIAQKRLHELAEFAADEWAARHSDNPKSVAEAIYTCAQQISDNKQPQWGLAMASNKSELRARIERLLQANQSHFQTTAGWAKGTVMASLMASVITIPALAIGEKEDDSMRVTGKVMTVQTIADGTRYSFSDSDTAEPHTTVYNHKDDGRDFSVALKGQLRLAEDGIHVHSVSDDGYLHISETGTPVERKVKYSNEQGELKVAFKRNGATAQMNDEDKQWLRDNLLAFHRRTGNTAPQRVKMLLASQGMDGALAEINNIKPSAVRYYSAALLNSGQMSDDDKLRLIAELGRNKSHYERRMAFTDWLLMTDLSSQVKDEALNQMKKIRSDFEMRMLLTSLLNSRELTDDDFKGFVTLADTIDSNYEHRMLITDAIKSQAQSSIGFAPYFELAKKAIRSDYEMRMLISSLLSILKEHDDVAEVSIGALKTIGSDYELRLTVVSIAKSLELDSQQWLALINELPLIDSDHELTQALIFMLKAMPEDQQLMAAVKEVAQQNITSRDSRRKLRDVFARSQ